LYENSSHLHTRSSTTHLTIKQASKQESKETTKARHSKVLIHPKPKTPTKIRRNDAHTSYPQQLPRGRDVPRLRTITKRLPNLGKHHLPTRPIPPGAERQFNPCTSTASGREIAAPDSPIDSVASSAPHPSYFFHHNPSHPTGEVEASHSTRRVRDGNPVQEARDRFVISWVPGNRENRQSSLCFAIGLGMRLWWQGNSHVTERGWKELFRKHEHKRNPSFA